MGQQPTRKKNHYLTLWVFSSSSMCCMQSVDVVCQSLTQSVNVNCKKKKNKKTIKLYRLVHFKRTLLCAQSCLDQTILQLCHGNTPWREKCVCVQKVERNMIDCMSITEYVCNATLCGFDVLWVGSESYVPPAVHRRICLLLHQWGSDSLMSETGWEAARASEWHRQRRTQTASVSTHVKIVIADQELGFSIDVRNFKNMDAKMEMSLYFSFSVTAYLASARAIRVICLWLSADIVTMQVSRHNNTLIMLQVYTLSCYIFRLSDCNPSINPYCFALQYAVTFLMLH